MTNDRMRNIISRLLLEFQVNLQSEQFNRVLILAQKILDDKKKPGDSTRESAAQWVLQWREITNWEGTFAILSEIEESDLEALVKELTRVERGLRSFSKNDIPFFQKAFELIPAKPIDILNACATLLKAYNKLKITDEKLRSCSVSSNETDTESVSSETEVKLHSRSDRPRPSTNSQRLETFKLSDIQTLSAYFLKYASHVNKQSPALSLVKLYEHGMLTDLAYDVAGHRELIEESLETEVVVDALISLYEQTDIFSEENLFMPQVAPTQPERHSAIIEQFFLFKFLFNQMVAPRSSLTESEKIAKTPKIIRSSANQVFANFNALMRNPERDALLGFFKELNQERLNSLFRGRDAQANYDAVIASPEEYYAAVDRINASGSLNLHTKKPGRY